ncbi:MAG: glucose dehydrogenase [Paenibacillus sp.]|nr:glucose dehydrogenase [Paenibacillus sp.]
MKAVVIKNGAESQYVTVTDIATPALSSPDQVLIKLIRVGLDGTDREIIRDRYGVLPEGAEQMVIGHELLGVIVEAGEQAGMDAGQLVTALVRRPCEDESCICCRSGRQDFCQTGGYTERGIRGADGFIAEYVVESARYVVPLPDSCAEYGVLVEPQSIVEKVLNQLDIVQRRTAWEPKSTLIIGSGPLGILTAWTCLTMGLETHVWSKSPSDSVNAELIRQAGGIYHEALALPEESADRRFPSGMDERMTAQGVRPDIVWECSGHAPLAFEAMKVLNANGVLAMLGCSAGDSTLSIPCELINQEIVLKNKCIIGSVNASRHDSETGISRLQQIEEKFPGMLERLLTDRLTMEQLPDLDFAQITVKAVVELG